MTTVQKHLVPVWGDLYLHRITGKDIEAYKVRRLEQVTASTVNREISLHHEHVQQSSRVGVSAGKPRQPE
jgi:hypothetical protein